MTVFVKSLHYASLLALGISLLVLAGCMDRMSKEEKAAFEDAKTVIQHLPQSPKGVVAFSAGPYQGGTAVLGEGEVAFWVKDGTGYAVNSAARKVAPELDWAPDNIQYDEAFITATEYED